MSGGFSEATNASAKRLEAMGLTVVKNQGVILKIVSELVGSMLASDTKSSMFLPVTSDDIIKDIEGSTDLAPVGVVQVSTGSLAEVTPPSHDSAASVDLSNTSKSSRSSGRTSSRSSDRQPVSPDLKDAPASIPTTSPGSTLVVVKTPPVVETSLPPEYPPQPSPEEVSYTSPSDTGPIKINDSTTEASVQAWIAKVNPNFGLQNSTGEVMALIRFLKSNGVKTVRGVPSPSTLYDALLNWNRYKIYTEQALRYDAISSEKEAHNVTSWGVCVTGVEENPHDDLGYNFGKYIMIPAVSPGAVQGLREISINAEDVVTEFDYQEEFLDVSSYDVNPDRPSTCPEVLSFWTQQSITDWMIDHHFVVVYLTARLSSSKLMMNQTWRIGVAREFAKSVMMPLRYFPGGTVYDRLAQFVPSIGANWEEVKEGRMIPLQMGSDGGYSKWYTLGVNVDELKQLNMMVA